MINKSDDFITDDCHLMKGDCIQENKEIPDNSIGDFQYSAHRFQISIHIPII
jgi:hypothetical protein